MPPAITGYLWCALAALASAMATLLIKLSSQHGVDLNLVRLALLGAAGATYVFGFICCSVALQKLDISLAYPVMTGTAIATVAALGIAALDEPLTANKVAGMILIALGAVTLTR